MNVYGMRVAAILGFHILSVSMAGAQIQSLPTLAGRDEGAPESPSSLGMTAPTQDNPEATAAEATGPIAVTEIVSDDSVRLRLEKLLARYPGVRSVGVEVEDGVVTLTGHVADSDVRDRLRELSGAFRA